MRCVTAKPPNMLMAVSAMPAAESHRIRSSGRAPSPDAEAASGGAVRPEEAIRWIAAVGVALTAINMFGGFAVTQRMLAMFRK